MQLRHTHELGSLAFIHCRQTTHLQHLDNMCNWSLHHRAKPSIAHIIVFVSLYLIQTHVPNHATCAHAMTQTKHDLNDCSTIACCTLLIWLLSRRTPCLCNFDQQLRFILLQWHCLLRSCKLLPFGTYTIQPHYNWRPEGCGSARFAFRLAQATQNAIRVSWKSRNMGVRCVETCKTLIVLLVF